jgi:hypothetical protein
LAFVASDQVTTKVVLDDGSAVFNQVRIDADQDGGTVTAQVVVPSTNQAPRRPMWGGWNPSTTTAPASDP